MDSTFSERTARRVRSAMDSAGMSETELARRSGIARVTLGRRLAGHGSFALNEVEAIADALDLPLEALLLGELAA